ncbi:MAG: CSLREA domain-containing protein [Pseudomonadota bacterium]
MRIRRSVVRTGKSLRFCLGLTMLALSPLSLAVNLQQEDLGPKSAGKFAGKNLQAMATADFDGDGVSDLAVSYTDKEGAGVLLLRGVPSRAFSATSDTVFSETLTALRLPGPATHLLAGDFDADGKLDLLAARERGSSLWLLPGDGYGKLKRGAPVALPGEITALTAGEMNRRDGLPDLLVAVGGKPGPQLLVFQSSAGAVAAEPLVLPLPATAQALAVGELDGSFGADAVIAAGGDLVLLRGANLRSPGVITEEDLEIWHWGERPLDLEIGDFLPTRGGPELAVLDAGGRLAYLSFTPKPRRGNGKPEDGPKLVDEIFVPADQSARLQAVGLRQGRSELLVFSGSRELELVGTKDSAMTLEYAVLSATPKQLLPVRLDGDANLELLVLSADKQSLSVLRQKGGSSIVVNSAADSATAGDGACTLREAISNANADADSSGGDCAAGGAAETITFAIGGGAPETIALTTALPDMTSPINLDASSQCATPPCIVLDGSAIAGADIDALVLRGGSSTIRGLVINGFSRDGIVLLDNGGNVIAGNYLGTNAAGDAAVGLGRNAVNVRTSNNLIGGRTAADRNVMSGLGGAGVAIFVGTGNRVEGNHIGLDASGTLALPNTNDAGVTVGNVSGNTIGGTDPGAGNVLSANRWGVGIRRFSDTADPTEDNLVQGNLIGTNAAGTAAIGNSEQGVFIFDAPNNTIGGSTPAARNVVSGNGLVGDFAPYAGIQVFPFTGLDSSGNTIQGNYVGIDAAGSAALPNASAGVLIISASATQVGGTAPGAGNVISGNASAGISIPSPGAANNVIQGNRIGTDATGAEALPNGGQGIYLENTENNLIGGTEAGAGNLVSGNNGFGIQLNPNANSNTVQGNLVGTTADGLSALPNVSTGIFVSQASGNTIGGPAQGARNVVSGNGVHGIQLFDDTSNSQVQGNYVGIDAAGTGPLGNGEVGIFIGDRSTGITVGGTEPGAANVVSDNGTWGVFAGSAGVANVILGNLIGTDASGNGSLGNDVHGVFLFDSASQTIGGTLPGAGNTIVGSGQNGISIGGTVASATSDNAVLGNTIRDNTVHGVAISLGTGNRISRNVVVNNGGQAIELNGDGPSANDAQDLDTGANNLQNFPELDRAEPGSTIVSGALNSTPDTLFTVEYFSSADCLLREAGTFLESIEVTTDGNGDADVSTTLTATVMEGQGITATATDPDGNTSELSPCVPVAGDIVFANGFEETR